MEPIRSENKSKATYLPKKENSTSYPPDRTVLLIIDPVNDFLSEGGAAWELTKNTVKMHNVIENLQRVIAGARAKGINALLCHLYFMFRFLNFVCQKIKSLLNSGKIV